MGQKFRITKLVALPGLASSKPDTEASIRKTDSLHEGSCFRDLTQGLCLVASLL